VVREIGCMLHDIFPVQKDDCALFYDLIKIFIKKEIWYESGKNNYIKQNFYIAVDIVC
jgi:hypothetical protein